MLLLELFLELLLKRLLLVLLSVFCYVLTPYNYAMNTYCFQSPSPTSLATASAVIFEISIV